MGEPLVMACVSDVAGQLRGKGFPLKDLEKRRTGGVGWTPTNVQITCFDTIAPSPFGALGDVVLWPDPDRLVEVPLSAGPPLRLVLGDIAEADGTPWSFCLRGHLRHLLKRFEAATGLEIRASFEHEFMLEGIDVGPGFSVAGFRVVQGFGEALLAALHAAGMEPDSFLREYGPGQFEVTLRPKPALEAADDAVLLREITRAVAREAGLRATFAPILDPASVGNGVHIHLSFWGRDGTPRTHAPEAKAGLGREAGMAAGGIVRHMPEIVALTAASAVSYVRLTPHRWSAAFANLAAQDREAGLRICPTTARDAEGRARQFNMEYRPADATASPWLALSAVVGAALSGVEGGLDCPVPTEGDLDALPEAELAAAGVRRLPGSLTAALDLLEGAEAVRGWYPDAFVPVYIAHKRAEIALGEGMSEGELMRRYATVY
jgi:glutamine synthetase